MLIFEPKTLPSHVLFDVARNDAAPHSTRLAATEELIDRDDRRALHADLHLLAQEVFKLREKVVSVVKSEHKVVEAPRVGVTTANQMQVDIIDNKSK